MTQRIYEAATLTVDPSTKALRVCLISEGSGSSADYPASFFTQENADRLADSLSFPGHPMDLDHPEHRDPLSAVGSIGPKVVIETDAAGKKSFWGDYIPSKSKQGVAEYLEEYGSRLGLSIYSESEGHEDRATGKWVAEALSPNDPYRSVDIVVAPGARGKFDVKVAEGLRRVIEAAAGKSPVVEEEINMEIKDVEKVVAEQLAAALAPVTKVFEGLVERLDGKYKADIQAQADSDAVKTAVEAALANAEKVNGLLAEAKLTPLVEAEVREFAKTEGVTIEAVTAKITAESAKLAEARKGFAEDPASRVIAESHRGSGDSTQGIGSASTGFDVPAFGQVR